ncbi:bifunctional metallophosphatase/5'-nucleotidase [Akkermansiaceae bacterium]|nr:bifunctional metallophosphatase/5'-nucleotidase [Akkermansiaceae bacterium]
MPTDLSRRHFIATGAAWAAGRALAGAATAQDHRTISIIHTTDLHGHILPTQTYSGQEDLGGFARCATQIRLWRKQNPDSLLVDVGDLYQGTAASFHNEGRLFVDLLANFGYDAWTLGNHDFDWGPEVLENNIKAAKIPILTANINGAPEKVIPWRMREVGGFKIALIGLVTPGLPFWLMPETLGGFAATDPVLALKKSIAQARSAKADAIVVLGHYGQLKEDDFANPLRHTLTEAPGADIFIAGHTHKHIPSLEIGGTLYTQANYFGIHCGKVDLTFDVHTRKLIAKTAVTEYMDKRFDLDPGVINLSQPELKTAEEQLARVLTTLKEPIPGKKRDSPLARLLCQSISDALRRNKTPADAIFHGTFGTPEIPAGPVTVADAWEILPYENTLVTATITPAQLLEIIAEDRKTYSDRTLWPYEIVWEKRTPVRILNEGKDLPADKPVTIAFNSYDSQSGGRKLMRLREIVYLPSSNRQAIDINTRDALIESLLNS